MQRALTAVRLRVSNSHMAVSESGTRRASDKSTVELAGDLARQTSTLMHHELELVKADVKQKVRVAGAGAGALGTGGVAALLGAACFTVAAIAALHVAIPLWAAALVMGGIYMFVAGVSAGAGLIELRRARGPVGTEAIESTKEEAAWLTRQARSSRRSPAGERS